jgi:hypothetical protein
MSTEFDLQRAINGEPIETIEGTPAEFIAYRPTADKDEQIVAQVGVNIMTYHTNGKYYDQVIDSSLDLHMKHVLQKIDWSNIPEDTIISTPEGDRHIAKCSKNSTLLLTYPEGKSSFTCGLRELEEHPKAKCYLVEQQPWTVWQGGDCPLPDGLEFEYMTHKEPWQVMGGKESASSYLYLWGTKLIYAYKLTGKVLSGWTL